MWYQAVGGTDRFARIVPKLPQRIDELISVSFPDLHSVHRNRLRVEEQIKKDPFRIGDKNRRVLIREPFNLRLPTSRPRAREIPRSINEPAPDARSLSYYPHSW